MDREGENTGRRQISWNQISDNNLTSPDLK